MVATLAFNPSVTTVAAGTFNISSEGYVQGTSLDSPAIRNSLVGGVLSTSETLPMWGGVAVYEDVPGASGAPNSSLGPVVGRATSSSNLLGFSVFDQAYGMLQTPQSPVPLAGSGMSVNYYRLGSGARIAVACDTSLASLEGGLTNASVAWDYVNQRLIPYDSIAVSSGAYVSGTGVVTLTLASAHGLSVGDTFTIASATGTGSYASINGTFQCIAGTTGSTLVYTIATGLTLTITGGTMTTGSALPVKVLDINVGGSQIVSYNSTTGFATWTYNGSTAIILI